MTFIISNWNISGLDGGGVIMKLLPTIRAHIEKYMREQNLKLQHFSDITEINVGTLSAILKGSRPMSINQLNQITSAMGLEQGYFYETYE